jgi:general stress protein 26
MAPTDSISKLNELIQGIPTAVLTTVRPDSSLHSRPRAAQPIDDSGAFWFLTGSNTEKVEAVRTIQRVNLAFLDHAADRYVSVSGFCELVRNSAKAKSLWKPEYKTWFPGGLEDPDLVLMRIVVQEAEYWVPSQGHMLQLTGFPNELQ